MTVRLGVAVAVNVTVDVVVPPVMVPPPESDHAYVAPLVTGTLAVRPAVPAKAFVVDNVMVVSGSGTQVFDAGRVSWYAELQYQLQPFGLEQYAVAFAGAVHVTGLPPQEPELLQISPVVQTLPSSHDMPGAGTQTYLPF